MKISLILLLLYTNILISQETIKGKIIDSETGTVLPHVSLTNKNDGLEFKTNQIGLFKVPKQDIYIIKKMGYKTEEILINSEYQVIQLSINPSELNEVIVSSNQVPKRLKKSANTIDIITSNDINKYHHTNIASALNRTPGVFMQSGALNTNRITIRGIGSRNLFGTAKIRAYFKDIPLTNGSGETNIEDFELIAISRIEIDKGASSIYGAGLGGTIHLTPQSAYLAQTTIESEFSFGSFGLSKEVINLNQGSSKNSFRAVYSKTHSDGFRENNEYDRQTITLNTNHFLGEKDEIMFLASYVDLNAFIPSSISESSYRNNPSSAAFTWKQAKGYEDSQRGIFGASWHHEYHSKLKQSTSIFTSFRNGYEPRPFDILDETVFALGIRTRLLGNNLLYDKSLDWTAGIELFKDYYHYGTFENLYQDYPEGTGSVEGNRLSNFKEKRGYTNIFFESIYSLSENTSISFGLNFNQTGYNLEDRFPSTTENPDQSGSFNFKGILSPKLGVSYTVSSNIAIYSNVSHGFSPITLQETLLPDGQINNSLKPETGWNFEIGSRGSLIKDKLLFNLAIYRLDVRNLLVSRRTAEDQFIGVNAGRTQHDGIELNLNYKWLNKESFSMGSFLSYSLNNYIFKAFVDDNANYSGNELTGVPKDIFNAGLDFNSKLGFYGNFNFQYVGSMPITDSNSLFSDSYKLVNLKVGYKTAFFDNRLTCGIFYGLDNIFDEAYASQILINTTGFGNSAPRYYYPGNPVNYYAGININYRF